MLETTAVHKPSSTSIHEEMTKFTYWHDGQTDRQTDRQISFQLYIVN